MLLISDISARVSAATCIGYDLDDLAALRTRHIGQRVYFQKHTAKVHIHRDPPLAPRARNLNQVELLLHGRKSTG
jgi:hypothetical protein